MSNDRKQKTHIHIQLAHTMWTIPIHQKPTGEVLCSTHTYGEMCVQCCWTQHSLVFDTDMCDYKQLIHFFTNFY